MTSRVAENWHMGSFFHLTFYLIFFDYFYFIYLLFYFVQFLFLVILFSSYSFSFLNFSYSFSSLFNFFLFHFVFWNETKWKPRGREMTQHLKKHDGWRQQQCVRLNDAKKSHILLAPYEMLQLLRNRILLLLCFILNSRLFLFW